MSQPTCVIPYGWSLAQACVALCERARVTGATERARFNWVELVTDAGTQPDGLARAYWQAVAARRLTTEGPSELTLPVDQGAVDRLAENNRVLRALAWRTECAA